MARRKLTIVGAGLAGSLLGVLLARRGYPIEIFERRQDMRAVDISAGRSINLALSTRGIHAIAEAGLRSEVMELAIPMRGRMIHGLDGGQTFLPYGQKPSEVIHSISRGGLNAKLMDAAEAHPDVTIHFNQRCVDFDLAAGNCTFQHDSGERQTTEGGPVFAADGAFSAVRLAMMLNMPRLNYSQDFLTHGYKELEIPAAEDGSHRIEKNALHIWPRGSFMLIALPNLDGSFTVTLFLPFEGPEGFDALATPESVLAFFTKQFPDAVPLMPNLGSDFFENPTGALVTVRCAPWHSADRVVLLGDAAHAIVPFFGQGMNAAFEDCTVLNALVDRHGDDWLQIFAAFSQNRKPDADAIAELALQNFLEMQDHVADPKFRLRRKVELLLEQRFPNHFVPKYSMVTFHRIPYSLALARSAVQEQLLRTICAGIDSVELVDWEAADGLVRTELPVLEPELLTE